PAAGVWLRLPHPENPDKTGAQLSRSTRPAPPPRGGGELETEVADRAAPVVLEHAERLPRSGTLVVVSHGGTIRTTIGRLLGLDAYDWEGLGGLSNCCWSVLGEGARGWRLLEHNAGTLPEPVLGDDD
ncbi:histidine phosphatase family protein, partial [Streptomyces sp. NPDC054945]